MNSIFVAVVLTVFCLAGCEKQESIHGLTADEAHLAEVNAKQWFEKKRIDADNQGGQFISCRPSDSNANGMVSCFGKIPQAGGGYKDVKMYCGYKPELAGCSDEDTVPK